jgi:hypothetical protein
VGSFCGSAACWGRASRRIQSTGFLGLPEGICTEHEARAGNPRIRICRGSGMKWANISAVPLVTQMAPLLAI